MLSLGGVRSDDGDLALFELRVLQREPQKLFDDSDFSVVVNRSAFVSLPTAACRRDVDEHERTVKTHESVLLVQDITSLDFALVELVIRDSNQAAMHAILNVELVNDRVRILDKSREQRLRSLKLKLVSRTELLLITN